MEEHVPAQCADPNPSLERDPECSSARQAGRAVHDVHPTAASAPASISRRAWRTAFVPSH